MLTSARCSKGVAVCPVSGISYESCSKYLRSRAREIDAGRTTAGLRCSPEGYVGGGDAWEGAVCEVWWRMLRRGFRCLMFGREGKWCEGRRGTFVRRTEGVVGMGWKVSCRRNLGGCESYGECSLEGSMGALGNLWNVLWGRRARVVVDRTAIVGVGWPVSVSDTSYWRCYIYIYMKMISYIDIYKDIIWKKIRNPTMLCFGVYFKLNYSKFGGNCFRASFVIPYIFSKKTGNNRSFTQIS